MTDSQMFAWMLDIMRIKERHGELSDWLHANAGSLKDALVYIEQLEGRIESLKEERA